MIEENREKTIDQDFDLNDTKRSNKKQILSILVVVVVGVLIITYFVIQAFQGFHLFKSNTPNLQSEKVVMEQGRFTLPEITPPSPPVKLVEPKPVKPKVKEIEQVKSPEKSVIIVQKPKEQEEKQPSLTEQRLASKPSKNKVVPVMTEKNEDGLNIKQPVQLSSSIIKIPHPSYTLLEGTKIGCTLETKIVSGLAGMVTCVVNTDIYSMDAKVLLVEKGSKMIGTYGGQAEYGDTRVGAIWSRIVTPEDLSIELSGISAGSLGGSGIPAHVDNHWFERIGAALLVSFAQDLFDYASTVESDSDGDGNNFVYSDSDTSDTTEDLAQKILDKTINLDPTLTVMNGKTINIVVNQDIDFFGVYDVK